MRRRAVKWLGGSALGLREWRGLGCAAKATQATQQQESIGDVAMFLSRRGCPANKNLPGSLPVPHRLKVPKSLS